MTQAANQKSPSTPDEQSLPKTYQPEAHEERIRERWMASGAFHADPGRVLSGERKPYSVVIPPPNVTGVLHLGHALNNTLQDILVRAHRMMGYEALWMPGADHAGIATQTVVEKRLIEEGHPARIKWKREDFVDKVQEWKDDYEERIKGQLLAMGCSCDWDRWRFTMDEVCARAVREAFFRLFKDGLIYRGKRLVNWDPVTQTALADDEVEMEEVDGNFYYLRYPLVKDDGSALSVKLPGGETIDHVTVATTRPETYLGDTAVAVNPKDARWEALRDAGAHVKLPFVGRVIPVIADEYVVMPEPEVDRLSEPIPDHGSESRATKTDPKAKFATGFLKVTPAHDPNDWDIGQRHGLPVINVMSPDASISALHGWSDVGDADAFLDLSREEAREAIVAAFKSKGLLEDIRPHRHSVGHSYRSHVPIEPYLSDQWYVRVTDNQLRGRAQRALAKEQRTSESLLLEEKRKLLGGTALRAVSSLIDKENYPAFSPPDFVAMDPYPPGQPSPRSLLASIRNLPHLSMPKATYFVTWRTAKDIELNDAERKQALDALVHWHGEKCHLYFATVMNDHVHCVVRLYDGVDLSWWAGSVKKYSARQINAHRGSTGHLWQEERFDHIVRDGTWMTDFFRYVLWNPVEAGLCSMPSGYSWTVVHEDVVSTLKKVASGATDHGSESRATSGAAFGGFDSENDDAMRFFPARYAKMYESWHDNIRDWCISRQLWWGHRIPVWSSTGEMGVAAVAYGDVGDKIEKQLKDWKEEGRVAFAGLGQQVETSLSNPPLFTVCLRDGERDTEIVKFLHEHKFVQDPDVLDTWFSSALWPLSTMGWPDPDAQEDTKGLVDAFNPTSVLSTAREIITLWVSRMVMFNRYLTDDHRVPFHHVYIHMVVQDGDGKRMSKSAGNGVDPLDIIHSHGADAMRFTLCQMATQTQDVRMPVERDPESGRNTSPKFDIGKRFCNKLWNAARFTMMMLGEAEDEGSAGAPPADISGYSLVDRWMLSRLAGAVQQAEAALADYQFAAYAENVYDLMWRDFCDWYLEAVKPTIKKDAGQQAVLRAALGSILRLLHPVCPFVTEAIAESFQPLARRGAEAPGVALGDFEMLCTAPWPVVDASLRSGDVESRFERLRELVSMIRDVRERQQVPPRRRVTLHVDQALAKEIAEAGGMVETLAGLEKVEAGGAPDRSSAFRFQSAECRLSGLVDEADAGAAQEAERERLQKRIEDLDKSILVIEKRLGNPGYVDKAPAKLVEQSKAQLEAQRAEREAAAASLERLK